MIREVTPQDAEQICDIYNHYIANSTITFEEKSISPEEMVLRIQEITSALPWFIYEEGRRILGYAHASKWKGRCSYRFSAESTVYTRHDSTGKTIGTKLYTRLIEELKERKIHAVIAGIALPNEASRKIHERLGFKKIGHFEEVGFKNNRWIDVGYWELIL